MVRAFLYVFNKFDGHNFAALCVLSLENFSVAALSYDAQILVPLGKGE